ncbi:thiamine pyrophosphate-binding protein [Variovorax terrae]|uniref:Thiamine pyrophosphate-binding protein n=1 Tax=Variovorax terrae TaxID=2923278 RepID=A0A9X1VY81_9BURK|nr:thiamine pyrophosphate-binding protein [Variovorax terrae]MCJ0765505.1 thiamine pyrophosphate-binding protein [Variovorax terrae]
MYGFELIASTVAELGFRQVFGLMGAGNLPWLCHGVDRALFEYVSVRHEASAVNAAAGYARASGRVGLATTTHGPGIGNAFTALAAAARDNSPVVLLIGIPALSNPTAPQRMDHRSFVELTGAAFHQVEQPEKIASTLVRATKLAYQTRQPQVVGIYNDHQEKELASHDAPWGPGLLDLPRAAPAPTDIARAVDLLSRARMPAILVGQGAVHSEAKEAIQSLGQHLGAAFCHSMLAQNFFDRDQPDVGLVGVCSHPQTDLWLRDADCVLVFGASLNNLQTKRQKLFEGKPVIHVDSHLLNTPDFHRVDVSVIGDARLTAQALLAELCARDIPARPPAAALSAQIASFYPHRASDDVSDSTGIDPRTLFQRLHRDLPEDRMVVTDGGRCIETLHHLLPARDARSYLYTSGFASIGLGIGAALGAGYAAQDRPLVLVCGDGGFLMNAQELDTVTRYHRQMLVIVMNDAQYGSESRHLSHLRRDGHTMSMAAAQWEYRSYEALARAVGGAGETLRTKEDLDNFRITPEKLRGLYLVDVRTRPDFDVWVEWAPKKLGLAAAPASH